jgi:methylated-DNA-[protein]-cysteine S-methyltransferase
MPRSSTHPMRPHHLRIPSAFGALALVWHETGEGPKVLQVFLPRSGATVASRLRESFPDSRRGSCPAVDRHAERIRRFLEGEPVDFSLDDIALDRCSAFQQSVLRAEWRIPRGRTATYAEIARRIGRPGAARAVGSALARNPFPIFIPCHRAVRSDGTIGGYQGGAAMKRALLALEGSAGLTVARRRG